MAPVSNLQLYAGAFNFEIDPESVDIETLTQFVASFRHVNATDYLRILTVEMDRINKAVAELNQRLNALSSLRGGTAKEGSEIYRLLEAVNARQGKDGFSRAEIQQEYSKLKAGDPDERFKDSDYVKGIEFLHGNPDFFAAVDTLNQGDSQRADGIIGKEDFARLKEGAKPGENMKESLDLATNKLKQEIEKLQSIQQLVMISLQKTGTVATETIDWLSNFLKKQSDSRATPIRNMG